MDFQTDAQRKTYEKVAVWMKELFGEGFQAMPGRPVFIVPVGSSVTQIAVQPWGTDDAVIAGMAWVVQGVEITKDLLLYLLRTNMKFRFGGYGLDDDDDIFFSYSIVGSTADKEEVKALTLAVAGTADREDDQIVAKWGGMTAIDKMKASM
ncbi:MAG: YbjN domain-containing protein [Acidimicrobiia bacterium]|nr:YbjN domain-containing protein [Acidimicrobiia bacterium]